MFSLIISVIMFIITLPMKAVEMGYKTYKVASKFSLNSKDKDKNKSGILNKLKTKRNKFSKDSDKNNIQEGAKNIAKFAIKGVKYVIGILRAASLLLGSISLITTIFMSLSIFVFTGAVGGSVMFMLSNNEGGNWLEGGMLTDSTSSDSDNSSSGSGSGNFNGNAVEALNTMGQWYVGNISKYGDIKFDCDLVGTGVRADCTGLACAVIWYILGDSSKVPLNGSRNMLYGSEWGTNLCNYGFEMLDTTNMTVEDLKPGDLLIGAGHAEFYVSPETKFGWGSVKKAYPVKGTFYKNGNYFGDSSHDNYSVVYRYVGGN